MTAASAPVGVRTAPRNVPLGAEAALDLGANELADVEEGLPGADYTWKLLECECHQPSALLGEPSGLQDGKWALGGVCPQTSLRRSSPVFTCVRTFPVRHPWLLNSFVFSTDVSSFLMTLRNP